MARQDGKMKKKKNGDRGERNRISLRHPRNFPFDGIRQPCKYNE